MTVLSKVGRLPAHILSLLVLIVIWEAAALFTGSRLLPGPGAVALRLADEVIEGGLLFHLAATLGRVAASFAIAMAIGTALGIAMGRITLLDRFLDGWLVLFLNVPALVTIILAYVWFGLTGRLPSRPWPSTRSPTSSSLCGRAPARSTATTWRWARPIDWGT